MKAILISIKPEWVAKILNGEKTIEIRKTMPKCEFPVEVYIYCTKGKPYLHRINDDEFVIENNKQENDDTYKKYYGDYNGKVVAKFTLNKVKEYIEQSMMYDQNSIYENEVREQNTVYYSDEYIGELQSTKLDDLLEKSCLINEELEKYIGIEECKFYAWHIDNLVIFDMPKELKDFSLSKAPQSWQYVEVREE